MSAFVHMRSEAAYSVVTVDDGKVNALSLDVIRAVAVAVDDAQARRLPLVIAGREGVFSAGFHLPTLSRLDHEAGEMVMSGFRLAVRLLACPVPVVIACTGHAVAMGCFLLLSADYRIGAAGDFRIGANEVERGIPVPDVAVEICRQRLAPVALNRALVTSEMFRPEDARTAGFLDLVVSPEEVLGAAEAAAQRLASLDMVQHAATKLQVRGDAIAAARAALEHHVAVGWLST